MTVTQRKTGTTPHTGDANASAPIPASSSTPNNKSSGAAASYAKTALIALFWVVVFFFMGSQLLTETWLWGYRGKWTNKHTYLPARQQIFTEAELLKYDGSNPNLPIYLAVDGDVFDVTQGRGWYGWGGSYNHFAGRDAARAYVTGCFKEHLTHDLRGLTPAQIKGVDHWKRFYANHHKYFKVGTVVHPEIDPSTPIPPPCKQSVGQKPGQKP